MGHLQTELLVHHQIDEEIIVLGHFPYNVLCVLSAHPSFLANTQATYYIKTERRPRDEFVTHLFVEVTIVAVQRYNHAT